MKLVIASDLHGSALYCGMLLERIAWERPDKILLLGDLLYHGPRNGLPEGYAPKQVIAMLSGLKEKIIAVRGNCEAEVDQMVLPFSCMADYTVIVDGAHQLYATHGHLWNPDKLPPLEKGSAFLYGHTHKKDCRLLDGILVLNPGSVSIPKDGCRGYMVYESGVFTQKTLAGEPVQSASL